MKDDLFRLPEAMNHDPAIDAWLSSQVPDLGAIAAKWFARMRRCGDDVREVMHDGQPTACVGDAAFGYVDVFTRHVNLGFFLGAELDDPAGLLQGTGRRMRHVKLQPPAEPDDAALGALTEAAYLQVKLRASL